MKKYPVISTEAEREQLKSLIAADTTSGRQAVRLDVVHDVAQARSRVDSAPFAMDTGDQIRTHQAEQDNFLPPA